MIFVTIFGYKSFFILNLSKHLDPSYKLDLIFWDCVSEGVKSSYNRNKQY